MPDIKSLLSVTWHQRTPPPRIPSHCNEAPCTPPSLQVAFVLLPRSSPSLSPDAPAAKPQGHIQSCSQAISWHLALLATPQPYTLPAKHSPSGSPELRHLQASAPHLFRCAGGGLCCPHGDKRHPQQWLSDLSRPDPRPERQVHQPPAGFPRSSSTYHVHAMPCACP